MHLGLALQLLVRSCIPFRCKKCEGFELLGTGQGGVSCSEIHDGDTNLFSGSSITFGQAAALFNIRKNWWAQERKGFFLLWPSLLIRETNVICSGVTCSLQQRGIHWSRRRFRRRNVCVGTAKVLWTFISLSSGRLNANLPLRHTHWVHWF